MIQIDTDKQDARHETRVVGTGNTIYEYVQAVMLLATVVGQAAIVGGVLVTCAAWLVGLMGWVCWILGILTTAVMFYVGIWGFLKVIKGARDSHTPPTPRGEDGRFIPVYSGGKHEFDLYTTVKSKLRGKTK